MGVWPEMLLLLIAKSTELNESNQMNQTMYTEQIYSISSFELILGSQIHPTKSSRPNIPTKLNQF